MKDCCSADSQMHHHPCKKVMMAIISLLALCGAIYVIILSRNALRNYDYIGKNPDQINTMMFNGEGKVEAKPDIANITMGLMVEKTKVSDAQKESTDVMNQFITKVKTLGVDSKDIKTANYSIMPQFDWNKDGKQTLRAYQVSQNVELKIRNLDKVGDILALAGELNLNQVGSLNFDIDQKDELLKQARKDAIVKAKQKAEETAKDLGISLGKIVSFSENNAQPPVIYNAYPMAKTMNMEMGASPEINAGNAELTVDVSISYEIR